jgi:hypothetical protein
LKIISYNDASGSGADPVVVASDTVLLSDIQSVTAVGITVVLGATSGGASIGLPFATPSDVESDSISAISITCLLSGMTDLCFDGLTVPNFNSGNDWHMPSTLETFSAVGTTFLPTGQATIAEVFYINDGLTLLDLRHAVLHNPSDGNVILFVGGAGSATNTTVRITSDLAPAALVVGFDGPMHSVTIDGFDSMDWTNATTVAVYNTGHTQSQVDALLQSLANSMTITCACAVYVVQMTTPPSWTVRVPGTMFGNADWTFNATINSHDSWTTMLADVPWYYGWNADGVRVITPQADLTYNALEIQLTYAGSSNDPRSSDSTTATGIDGVIATPGSGFEAYCILLYDKGLTSVTVDPQPGQGGS